MDAILSFLFLYQRSNSFTNLDILHTYLQAQSLVAVLMHSTYTLEPLVLKPIGAVFPP